MMSCALKFIRIYSAFDSKADSSIKAKMNKSPLSLFLLQATYLLDQIKLVAQPPGLYALVVDRRTEAALYQVISKQELLRVVTAVEVIDAKRPIQAFLQAIYLVELLIFNFNCILADVRARRYKLGHGLFIPLSQWEEEASHFFHLAKFLQNPAVDDYFNGGANIGTVHASMVPVESRVFLADKTTPNSMSIYYNENCGDLVLPQVRRAARAIVNTVVVAGEYPFIRFYSLPESTHQAARLPELIADEVQRQLDEYSRANHDYPPPSAGDKPRAILLICDRTLDLYAPLLHEFTYQAMAMDIVEGLERNNKYIYHAENERGEDQEISTSLDSEDDETWMALRHMHIIEASELIIGRINDLIKNNPLMVDRTKAKTSSDLMYVVAHLQGFDEERRQVTLHKTLIDECLDINARRKLAEFAADFEQTCAAEGTSFEGVHNKHLHDDLIVLLARDDLHVNDKVRLVLIYSLYRGGLAESDFVKLAKFIGVKDNQIISLVLRCFYNLRKLGFPIVKKSVRDKKVVRQTFHTINNEGTYNTSRFAPGLKRVLYNAAKYELDEDWFPYFRDKPLEDDVPRNSGLNSVGGESGSLRNPRVKASWAPAISRSGSTSTKNRQRVFCFVAGGITHSEIRLMYELSSSLNKDFYLGSESVIKPRDFLIGLQSIDDVKTPQSLDLALYWELSASTKAPDYLYEVPKPKMPAPPNKDTPAGHYRQLPSSKSSRSLNNSVISGGFGTSIPNPQLAESKALPSTPKHYQKRISNSGAIGGGEKEKKTSRLKRLFK